MSRYTQAERDDDLYLEHYGVKGMRWGVRKASSDSKKPKEPKGPSKSDRIKKARELRPGLLKKLERAETDYMNSKSAAGQKKTLDILNKAEDDYLSNESLAKKFTVGEKVAIGVGVYFALNIVSALATMGKDY